VNISHVDNIHEHDAGFHTLQSLFTLHARYDMYHVHTYIMFIHVHDAGNKISCMQAEPAKYYSYFHTAVPSSPTTRQPWNIRSWKINTPTRHVKSWTAEPEKERDARRMGSCVSARDETRRPRRRILGGSFTWVSFTLNRLLHRHFWWYGSVFNKREKKWVSSR
jgi:hypothetical protein